MVQIEYGWFRKGAVRERSAVVREWSGKARMDEDRARAYVSRWEWPWLGEPEHGLCGRC